MYNQTAIVEADSILIKLSWLRILHASAAFQPIVAFISRGSAVPALPRALTIVLKLPPARSTQPKASPPYIRVLYTFETVKKTPE